MENTLIAPVRRVRGFTLIELMIVLVVVGILAAIALPSYRQHVITANRTQAQQYMQDIANKEEQYRLDQRRYTSNLGSGALNMTNPPGDLALNYTMPPTMTILAPGDAAGADCNGNNNLVAPAYRINATAIGGQVSDGDLCLDSNGNKAPLAKWKR